MRRGICIFKYPGKKKKTVLPVVQFSSLRQEENTDYWKDTEKPPKKPRDFVESSDALEAFRAWAQAQGAELPISDHVMLFTG